MANSEWDDIKVFTESRSRGGDPSITITAKQAIVFNRSFMKESGLEKFEFVVLYYSKKNNALIFKFTNTKEMGALKISRSINASISARSFFNYYKFDKSFKGRFKPKKDEINDIGSVWVIYLSDPVG